MLSALCGIGLTVPSMIASTVLSVSRAPSSIRRSCNRSYILVGRDDDFFAIDYVADVDLMFEEECGDSGLVIAVDDSPVDRCGSAIARQQ